ncbi:unnamed protein product [Ectocarpus fasciculatus]
MVHLLVTLLIIASVSGVAARRLVFVGSYSNEIPIFELDGSGDLSLVTSVQDEHLNNPSWLAMHPSKKYIYALSEVDTFNGGGSVSSYRIGESGTDFAFMNEVPSYGPFPCHMAVDPEGKFLFVSNYGGGNMAVFRILESGQVGKLTQVVNHDLAAGAHVHEAIFGQNTNIVQVMDLGLNEIYQYHFDSTTGRLGVPVDPQKAIVKLPDGSGPRHLINHPYLNISIIISELDSTVSCLEYDKNSGFIGEVLTTVSTLMPRESAADMAAAEIQLSADGVHLFASNRDVSEPNKHRSSISVFKLSSSQESRCTITPVLQQASSLGIHPRHFALTYSSEGAREQLLLIANRDSNNIVTRRVNEDTGLIDQAGKICDNTVLSAPTQVLIVEL